jgi:hypothetical protein
LTGTRTAGGKLVIDEANGTFAGLRLGMPFASAKKLHPISHLCTSTPPGDLSYCSGRVGVIVTIVAACSLQVRTSIHCPAGSDTGPLAEIHVEAVTAYGDIPSLGDIIRLTDPESQEVITTRGLLLGASVRTLRKKYAIRDVVIFPNTECDLLDNNYTTIVGDNTVVFDVTPNKIVDGISLFAGREPDLCQT